VPRCAPIAAALGRCLMLLIIPMRSFVLLFDMLTVTSGALLWSILLLLFVMSCEYRQTDRSVRRTSVGVA
jgi:hypothetical protein